MNREYHKWYSPALHRDMEMLVFGHGGTPVLVFPTSMGRFYEYESRGMIDAIWDRYEYGAVQAFCVDSVDLESWYNRHVHPKYRAMRQNDYDNYIVHEVVPFIKWKNWAPKLISTGCSLGGYQALNFAFRHPDITTGLVSMGGAFDIHRFVNGYYDENCYFNCPRDYMRNMTDSWFLERIRQQRIVLGTSDWDICRGANYDMSGILQEKSIPHWLDEWGNHTVHDWPAWQGMAVKHIVP